jgi:hypothetical protein
MTRLFAGLCLWCLLCLSPGAVFSQEAAPPRVVSVTPDSEQGWVPPQELEQQARKTASDFLADEDSGRVQEAYALIVDIGKKDVPFAEFSDRIAKFNAEAGAVAGRHVTKLTWTKNPARAPMPGIYAALDLVSRFANIDRHCGYLVLYQAPAGGAFQVMRDESNYLLNATAAGMTPEEADKAWTALSSHCPGYQPSLPEAAGQSIGYPDVAAALAGLHAKPGTIFKDQNGWTVVQDDDDHAVWSFPPPGNPAYPAAVKRQFVIVNGAMSLKMAVHCEVSKDICDQLVRGFQELNAKMATGGIK